MGVFMPNIGRPMACVTCPRFTSAYNYCNERRKHIQKPWKRHPACPLVEIPNELVEAWQEYIKKAETIGKVKAVNVPKGEMT